VLNYEKPHKIAEEKGFKTLLEAFLCWSGSDQ